MQVLGAKCNIPTFCRGRDFKLTLSTKIKKVSSVKMLRHIIFHKRCLTIYNKWGLKCLKFNQAHVINIWVWSYSTYCMYYMGMSESPPLNTPLIMNNQCVPRKGLGILD